MKNKISISFALVLQIHLLFAQQISLKNPLTESDKLYLQKEAMDCFGYEASVNFSFLSNDFFDTKNVKADKSSSMAHIKELEKKLKGNYSDANIYNNIGLEYRGLFKKEVAAKNFNKALALAKELVKAKPDSSTSYDLLAAIYFDLENFTEAGKTSQHAYDINSKDSIAKFMIPMAYVFSRDFEPALTIIKKEINAEPDNICGYVYLSFYLYFKKYVELTKLDGNSIKLLLKNKTPEEIIDLTLIENAYKNHKDNIPFELVYRFTRHLSVCAKSMLLTLNDTSVTPKNQKFIIDEKDVVEFNDLEKFYLSCLNNTGIPNKFIIYKALGNIHLLKGETKDAIPFLQEAIKHKPLNKSKFMNNASEDYDNLAAAYLLLKDTTSFEKTITQKFQIKPAINPLTEDYIRMAKISFYHKDYEKAKKLATDALQMDENQDNAYICLAAIDLINKNTKDAFVQLEKANKINPNNYSMYFLQGICLLNDGDVSTAYYSFKKAQEFVNNPRWIDDEIINKFFNMKNK